MFHRLIPTLLLALVPALATAQAPPPARVVVSTVGESMVSTSARMEGVVDFDRVAQVAAEVSGRIDYHGLAEGALIEAGAPLVVINADFVSKDIDITRHEVREVEAELRKLDSNLRRLDQLLKTDATSRSAYDDALYSHQALQRRRDVLQERIERLRIRIEKSTVMSPFEGIVLERMVEVGEWTGPERPVARIASTDDVVVRVAVSEDLLRFLRPGDTINLEVPALQTEIDGTVRRISPVADLRSRSVELKIGVPYIPGMVQNMSARVRIPTSDERHLRTVKRDAVVTMNGRDFVFTVEDGKAKMLPVTIVNRIGDLIAVDDPAIVAGMSVVVDGNERLRPDQAVTVISELP